MGPVLSALIDRDFLSWYDHRLSPPLADLFPNGIAWDEVEPGLATYPIESTRLSSLLAHAMSDCHDPRLPYHGLAHSQRVTDQGNSALEVLRLNGQIELPEGLPEAVLLGLARHDMGHPGASFFADAAPERRPANMGDNVSVEWYSAAVSDAHLADEGCSRWTRLIATYTIWASTCGGDTERGRQMGLDRVRPKGLVGLLMRAADVAVSPDFTTAAQCDVDVNYGEILAGPRPLCWDEHLAARSVFLDYVDTCFRSFDEAAGLDITGLLGWRSNLRSQRETLERLKSGMSPVRRAIYFAQLSVHGSPLADELL